MTIELPDWVTFPEDDWVEITAEEAGLDPEKFGAFIGDMEVKGASFGGEDHSGDKYGAVITRGGYLVHAWGDRHYRHQTASVGKAFMWATSRFCSRRWTHRSRRTDQQILDRRGRTFPLLTNI